MSAATCGMSRVSLRSPGLHTKARKPGTRLHKAAHDEAEYRRFLRVLLLDERRKRREILLQHLLQGLLDQLALVIEGIANAVQIGLGLAHDRPANTRQDVLQSLGRIHAA